MTNEMNNIKDGYCPIRTSSDHKLLITTVILVAIGFMAVVSASLPYCISKHLFPFHFVLQHLMWITFGSLGMWQLSKFDYKKLREYAIPFTFGVILLLLIVKFTPLGMTINGARRWINLGFFRFQPSEFSKLSIIMLMGNLFSLNKEVFYSKLPKYLLTTGLMIFVILKQPNLSMTIILLTIAFCIYVCSGKSLKPVFIGGLVVACLAGMVATHAIDVTKFLEPHQIERLENSRYSIRGTGADVEGGGYQVFHSMIAISSGGLIGCGFGNSKEKLGWLPEAHTDFIFSVISEELGFLGSVSIILLFLILFYRGINIALRSPTIYGKLLAFGITLSITIQAFFNISVATSFLPATGITLPFISYGGSSLFVSMCMIGILLNISKTRLVRAERTETKL
ncbi:MAG: putative lipid II flippase FtsW [Cyanobacteria bacterium RUI128]|nr:putative lipid II flippase FtsW [Cyanobacteria bacterium RUI128]